MEYQLLFIVGDGVDKGMVIVEKGYSNETHDELIRDASFAGVRNPEITGHIDVPEHVADEMSTYRIYIG